MSRHPGSRWAGWALGASGVEPEEAEPPQNKGGPAGAERAEAPRAPLLPIPPGLTSLSQNCPTWSQRQNSDDAFDVEVSADPCSLGAVTSTLFASFPLIPNSRASPPPPS